MQKIFIRYAAFIMSIGCVLILFFNFLLYLHMLETQQVRTFEAKIEQVIHTLENNRAELQMMNENLDVDYLTRAKAAAYVLDRQEEVAMDVSQMQYLADLLNVDELHMIDENGIIASASVAEYIGMDMADHKQTRPFLTLLESDDPDAYLIQEPQPNASANKVMQYVGVARKSKKGIVQVGFEPVRQLQMESRNTYDYIFSKFPTDAGEELFITDDTTGEVLGHSAGMGRAFTADFYQLNELLDCEAGAYKAGDSGDRMFVVSRKYADTLICAALPGNVLWDKLLSNTRNTFLYLFLIETMVILLLNYLVKKKVISGIHQIIENLFSITSGNLDTTVAVGGNREFEDLSSGINTMVKSIIRISDRTSAIIEMSGIPLAAFEYSMETNHVFATSGLREFLRLDNSRSKELFQDSGAFDRYIHELMKNPVEGESDVFEISDRYIRIHMTKADGKHLGVVMDATKEIQEKLKMQYENTHDPLTGMYKFTYFKKKAAELIQTMPEGTCCAAAMLDLDYFKSINDTFGHDMGDQYLQSFSSVLHSMPAGHFLPARRSGDEFCMLIYNCKSREDILSFLKQFYDILGENRIALSDTQIRVISASCGVACTDDSSVQILELLSHADEALYEVKRSKKGYFAEYRIP